MKTFREFAGDVNELKIDSKTYEKFAVQAIKNINMMVEYGRKAANLDNKQLNPLLDAIKNIHSGEDAIRKSLTDESESESKIPKKDEKGKKEW